MKYQRGTESRRRGRPFVKGPDPRRHELTLEEKRRGGYHCWWKYMVKWHSGQFPAFRHPRPRKERKR